MDRKRPSALQGRALIVEDEYVVALDLVAAMKGLGFESCEIAASARAAQAAAMQNPPDLVLMDINLAGGHEGIEAARWLREVCGAPVVFITSYADDLTVHRVNEQVPGAPILLKANYRERLPEALAAVMRAG